MKLKKSATLVLSALHFISACGVKNPGAAAITQSTKIDQKVKLNSALVKENFSSFELKNNSWTFSYLFFCVKEGCQKIGLMRSGTVVDAYNLDKLLGYKNSAAWADMITKANAKKHYSGVEVAPLEYNSQMSGLNGIIAFANVISEHLNLVQAVYEDSLFKTWGINRCKSRVLKGIDELSQKPCNSQPTFMSIKLNDSQFQFLIDTFDSNGVLHE